MERNRSNEYASFNWVFFNSKQENLHFWWIQQIRKAVKEN